jgi:hypothetical protein
MMDANDCEHFKYMLISTPGGITLVQVSNCFILVTEECVFNITIFLSASPMYQRGNTRQYWHSKLPSQRNVNAQHG